MKRQLVIMVMGCLCLAAQAQVLDSAAIAQKAAAEARAQAAAQKAAEIKAMNNAVFDMYNEAEIQPLVNEAKILATGKEAHYGRALFGVTPNSQFTDGKVSVRYAIGGYDISKKETTYSLDTETHPALAITIENKTDEYVYVDLSKCVISFMGKMVTPSYEASDKLLLVAPHDKRDVKPVMFMENTLFQTKGLNKMNFTLPDPVPCILISPDLKQSERLAWTYKNSPVVFAAAIVYDTTPKMAKPVTLTATFYMKQVIGAVSKQLIGGSKNEIQIVNSHNMDVYFNADDECMDYCDMAKTQAIKIKKP